MKSIAKPGSFGSSRSATDERFTKNWLTDCAKPDGVNRVAYRKESRLVGSRDPRDLHVRRLQSFRKANSRDLRFTPTTGRDLALDQIFHRNPGSGLTLSLLNYGLYVNFTITAVQQGLDPTFLLLGEKPSVDNRGAHRS